MNNAYYVELARRSLGLANNLQYDSAARLLVLGLCEPEDGQPGGAPDTLMEAWTSFHFYENAAHPKSSYTDDQAYEFLTQGCKHLERFIREVGFGLKGKEPSA